MRWEIGLSTGIGYDVPLVDTLAPIRDAGFTKIQVSTAPRHLDLRRLERIAEIKRRIRALGLEVVAVHAPRGPHVDLTSPDEEMRRRTFDQIERAAEALLLLGGKTLVVTPSGLDHAWRLEREERMVRSLEGLRKVHAMCDARGLNLAVETPIPTLLGGRLDDMEWLLERLPHDTRVALDTCHMAIGKSLTMAVERLGSRLALVEVSDHRGAEDDHLVPGDGLVDWALFFAALEAVRYRGLLVLELQGGTDVSLALRSAMKTLEERQPRFLPQKPALVGVG